MGVLPDFPYLLRFLIKNGGGYGGEGSGDGADRGFAGFPGDFDIFEVFAVCLELQRGQVR